VNQTIRNKVIDQHKITWHITTLNLHLIQHSKSIRATTENTMTETVQCADHSCQPNSLEHILL